MRATTRTGTMTTTLTTIRMAIIRMPQAIHTLTTAIAIWSSDARTLRMAGTCNHVRYAVDGLSQIDVDCDLERSADRLSSGGREMTLARKSAEVNSPGCGFCPKRSGLA
jgi:hypothetical protein